MVRKLKKPNTGGSANSQQDIIRQAQVMQKEIVDLTISLDVLKDAVSEEDASIITDLILSAVNEVMTKAEEMAEKEMEVVTGGVNIPGLF